MDRLKRFIDIYVPVTSCNLQCHYCYIIDSNRNGKKAEELKFSPEELRYALRKERLGGACLFNMCGWGETMLLPQLADYVRELLEEGHYIWIVTNGLVSSAFDKMMELPAELKSHLGFKFSFHYLELKRLNLMGRFWENVNKARENGCSMTIEVTANDELLPYKKEVAEESIKNVGALPHITVVRNGALWEVPLLSKLTPQEFWQEWKEFQSDMLDNKMKVWGNKRTEYCYAGMWTGLLNMATGEFRSCYSTALRYDDVLSNPEEPISFVPIGKHCKCAHCFNSHAFLALGDIPELDFCTYREIRDRECADGSHWVQKEMADFIGQKLVENNRPNSTVVKWYYNIRYHMITKIRKLKRRLKGLK